MSTLSLREWTRPAGGWLRWTMPRRASSAGLVVWWRNRQAIHAMQALDDTRLQDLGVARGGIEHAVRNGRAPVGRSR